MIWHPLSDQLCYMTVGTTSGSTQAKKGPFASLLNWLREPLQLAQLSENEVNLILRLNPAETTREQLHSQLSVLDSITV